MNASRRGSILVGMLWCLALVFVIVVGVLHSSHLELQVVKNHGDQIQAHYLALAGVEKAKALLYQDIGTRKRAARNHSGELYDAPAEFKDIKFGRGAFSVIRSGRAEEGGGLKYGISDEESRLNINQASATELGKLYGLAPEVAAAIVDWRDGDQNTTPNGAEADYYLSLRPPYLPRNGPFETVRELLQVRGVTRDLLLGEDANGNGLLDPEENDGNASPPPDNHDGVLDAGWSELLAVHSTGSSLDAAGQERVNVQSADESALTGVPGITSDIAKAIVASRNQNRIETLADLLDVTSAPPNAGGQPNNGGPNRGPGGGNPGNFSPPGGGGGQKVIDQNLLYEIADQVTTGEDREQAGVVNVNTASVAVLKCLPGLDEQLAQAIVSYRQSAGFLANPAYLLKVPGITREIFKQLAPRVSVRSETFRILSEGTVRSTGVRSRIEAVVRFGSGTVTTLSYREDL